MANAILTAVRDCWDSNYKDYSKDKGIMSIERVYPISPLPPPTDDPNVGGWCHLPIGNAAVSVCDMKARERRKQEKPFEMT
jgi:hypothetical protein